MMPPTMNRAQRRAEDRADAHEEALEKQHLTKETVKEKRVRQAFVRQRVARREAGEAESIAKARAINPNARYATR